MTSNSPATNRKILPEQVGKYVVGLSEELKKVYASAHGQCHPELIVGRSEILDIDDVRNLTDHFLGETSWTLGYSTSLHQHSVMDHEKRLFGLFISTKLIYSEEKIIAENVILFHCRPTFEIIGLTRCTVKCRMSSLEIGDSEGKYSISLSENLSYGRLEECKLTDEKTCTNPKGGIIGDVGENGSGLKVHPFKIKTLECWVLGC